jgi:DNA-binding NtrC family response regulator
MRSKRARVLYIDEDVESAFVLDTLLRLAEYEPVTVSFASEALQMAQNEPFDLFVFGKQFPVDAGVYLSHKFREIAPEIPVIFLPENAHGFNLQGVMHN